MTTTTSEHRYKRIFISIPKILALFQRPVDEYANFFYLQGEPKEVEVIRAYYDPSYNVICLIVTHPSFEPIKIGETIPIHDEIFTVTMQRDNKYNKI